MKITENFNQERKDNVTKMGLDTNLKKSSLQFLCDTANYNYSYNFDWMSRPIIQYPQDIVAFQEIVWKVKPDLIIEMGVARGGSLILSASLLAMIDLCEYGETKLTPSSEKPRCVIGVDVDIRSHNRKALESHPLYPRINLIEGSSIDQSVIEQVKKASKGFKKILVCLDSNHTHDHVLAELEAYAPMTSIDSYCIVFDTVIEDMPGEMHKNRDWGPGNSPKSALWKFLENNSDFQIDKNVQDKLLITVAPDGYLLRT
jgi:cephalosporin hydroxylase